MKEYTQEWISCKDRNPDEAGQYLVTKEIYFIPDHVDQPNHYKGIDIEYYDIKYGWFDKNVYAWMKLPEIYEDYNKEE